MLLVHIKTSVAEHFKSDKLITIIYAVFCVVLDYNIYIYIYIYIYICLVCIHVPVNETVNMHPLIC